MFLNIILLYYKVFEFPEGVKKTSHSHPNDHVKICYTFHEPSPHGLPPSHLAVEKRYNMQYTLRFPEIEQCVMGEIGAGNQCTITTIKNLSAPCTKWFVFTYGYPHRRLYSSRHDTIKSPLVRALGEIEDMHNLIQGPASNKDRLSIYGGFHYKHETVVRYPKKQHAFMLMQLTPSVYNLTNDKALAEIRDHATAAVRKSHCYAIIIRCAQVVYLTHWDRVTHICVGKQTIIGSDNG